MKDLVEAAERWDMEPNPASLWWTSMCADEMVDDITISTGRHQIPFEKSFRFLEYAFQSSRKEARLFGRKNATCKQGLV